MKRFFMFALIAAALSFPAALSAAKGPDVVKGPACGDIDLAVDYTYDTPGATSGSATVFGTISTVAPSCKKGTYTFYVFDQSGATQLASCSYTGDGVTSQFGPCTYTSPTGDPLCVYATSRGNSHVIDAAPNEGCAAFGEPIVPGPSGATAFH